MNGNGFFGEISGPTELARCFLHTVVYRFHVKRRSRNTCTQLLTKSVIIHEHVYAINTRDFKCGYHKSTITKLKHTNTRVQGLNHVMVMNSVNYPQVIAVPVVII